MDYITESSVDEEELTHLTHARELHRVAPQHQNMAPALIRQFHNLRRGMPSSVSASHKVDGAASVIIGPGMVSDKHRAKRGAFARNDKQIDEYFGHAPQYAAALKHLLKHSTEIVRKGKLVQGDMISTPGSRGTTRIGQRVRTKPNRITYEFNTPAPVALAIHHEITGTTAHGISPGTVQSSRNVFIPQNEYKPDPTTYAKEDRDAVEFHLGEAEKLLKKHSTTHLTSDHIGAGNKPGHLHIYMNSNIRAGTQPTVEGYIKHLLKRGQAEAAKLKTKAGQQRRIDYYNGLIAHVKQNAKHFQRTLDVEHHLNMATHHVLKGVSHPDMKASIDGVPRPEGEGIVLSTKDNEGRLRPVVKLVDSEVSKKLLEPIHQQERFGKK